MKKMTSRRKAELKGQAHSLRPVVLVGQEGLKDTVIQEIRKALEVHELIKIQLPKEPKSSDEKDHDVVALMEILGVEIHLIGRIGRTVILFQEKKKEEK